MTTGNPIIQQQLDEAKRKLAELRAEKLRLFPPNPYPLSQPDAYPKGYSQEQIAQRNELNAQIESLENRIDELQRRLYSK